MYSQEYNDASKRLNDQLNGKETLIRFNTLSSIEYSLLYGDGHLTNFAIEWLITIEGKLLRGRIIINRRIITDSAIDITNVIIGDAIASISQAVLHPETISEAKIVVT